MFCNTTPAATVCAPARSRNALTISSALRPGSVTVTYPLIREPASMPTVVFRRDGAASTDLEVYLASSKELPNDWRAIQVVQSTGRTDWFRYLAGLWTAGSI